MPMIHAKSFLSTRSKPLCGDSFIVASEHQARDRRQTAAASRRLGPGRHHSPLRSGGGRQCHLRVPCATPRAGLDWSKLLLRNHVNDAHLTALRLIR
jgi:hypothetical protein